MLLLLITLFPCIFSNFLSWSNFRFTGKLQKYRAFPYTLHLMLTFSVTITHYQSQELPFTLEPIAIVLSCLQINNDLHITEPKGQFSDLILCDPSPLFHRAGNSSPSIHFLTLDSRSLLPHFPSLVSVSTLASSPRGSLLGFSLSFWPLNIRMSQSWVLKGPLLFPYCPDSLGDQSTRTALNTIYTLMTYTFSIFSLNFHSEL